MREPPEKREEAESFLAQGKKAEAAQKLQDAATQTPGTIDQINSLRCSVKAGKTMTQARTLSLS